MIERRFVERIAQELKLRPQQAEAAILLFDDGATIPFVARYRKDVTGNLDEVRLEAIAAQNSYFIELIARRQAILESIEKQGKLTPELREQIEACVDKTSLEDLYLPYKPKRRTKATVAREKGLEPLADFLWAQEPGEQSIDELAATFVNAEKGVGSAEEALEGARHIIAETIANDAEVRGHVRDKMLEDGKLTSTSTKNAEGKKTKFEAYYDFSEPVKSIPSHRFLAIRRGVNGGLLRMELALDDEAVVNELKSRFVKEVGLPFEAHIAAAVDDSYRRLLRPSIENEVTGLTRERADAEAIRVFRENAHNLLMAPPAGQIAALGVDPGLRTGCKLAVVDATGHFIESAVIYPTPPRNDVEGAEKTVLALIEKHNIKAVAIGNGTGARETSGFIKGVLGKLEQGGVFSVYVNESGASVYSASKLAREEFPDLDVTIRSAISIARRLQDPLAELVKIEPRSIGVGQYQHDVNQKELRHGLELTIESCVNRVGVNLNTASFELLRYVSGIQAGTAKNIVEFRAQNGAFKGRQQLLEVNGVGPRAFEQCAGFLRITGGDNPLDATAVHPEAYAIVEQIARTAQVQVGELIKNPAALKELDLAQFATDTIGALSLEDIRRELMKPSRDPRKEFRAPKFLEGVDSVAQLEVDMVMEGVVTNVTDFGAFVDIGVHQDGLVHLSELANRFVRDPRQVVKVGDIVKVKVIHVDKELPRISLSMKALLTPPKRRRRKRAGSEAGEEGQRPPQEKPQARGEAREDARDRKPREERPAREAREGGGRRPRSQHDKKDRDDRRGRRDDRQDRRGGGKRHERHGKGQQGKPASQDEKGLNTQLADQLAALRDKFK